MQSQLALARLKTRVDPVIGDEAKHYLRNNGAAQVRVKARINETGHVVVTGVVEGNPILNPVVREAVNGNSRRSGMPRASAASTQRYTMVLKLRE